jgi:hypothetical protein
VRKKIKAITGAFHAAAGSEGLKPLIKISRYCLKLAVVLFFALNLLTILNSNRPEWLPNWPQLKYRLGMYGHYVGLDNRWEMFSYIYRDDWMLVFKGKPRGPGAEYILPLALQSKRAWYNEWFFDFREAKYRLNIFGSKPAREKYAHYQCRQFDLEYVGIDYVSRKIFPREEARKSGQILSPHTSTHRIDTVRCPQ